MAEHSYSGKKHGAPPETWADLIHEKTVKDLLSQKNRELITLKDHFTLGQALEVNISEISIRFLRYFLY